MLTYETKHYDDGTSAFGVAPLPDQSPGQQQQQLAVREVMEELARAAKYPGFNSAHEGFAVLKEEVDELWDHVKVNQKRRDLTAMRAEAIQVAAMAIKFVQMLDAGRGRI